MRTRPTEIKLFLDLGKGDLKGLLLLLVGFDSVRQLLDVGFELLIFCELATGQLEQVIVAAIGWVSCVFAWLNVAFDGVELNLTKQSPVFLSEPLNSFGHLLPLVGSQLASCHDVAFPLLIDADLFEVGSVLFRE